MNLSGCSKRGVGVFSRILSPKNRPTLKLASYFLIPNMNNVISSAVTLTININLKEQLK